MVSDKPTDPDLPHRFDEEDDLDDRRDDPPPEPHHERGGFAAKVLGDLARRALTTGIGSVFLSEESLRSQLAEMKLPKEAMAYVVSQADRTKKDIVNAIARETREFLSRLEVDKVLARALVGTTVEIQTRIRILPKDDGIKPVVEETTTRVDLCDEPKKRRRKKRDDPDDAKD
ncbi:MAG: hypothetical protein IT382_13065 [Deltaproteobacteria bacterium]|nr:hypothetical protein [Deltaproteobacteria bacterium]